MTEEERRLVYKLYDLSDELHREHKHQIESLRQAIVMSKGQLAALETSTESMARSHGILGEMIGVVGKLIKPS